MHIDCDHNRVMRLNHRLPAVLAVSVLFAAPAVAETQAHIVAASDYVVQGVSQTRGDPTLQGGAGYAHSGGFFGGVWLASNKLIGSRYYEDRTLTEVDYYAGWRQLTDGGTEWSATLSHYSYPGEGYYSEYRYDELAVSVGLENGFSSTLGFTDNFYNEGSSAGFVEFAYERAVSADVVLNGGVGYYDTGRVFGEGYGYWNIGATRLFGRYAVDLNYIDTDSEAGRIFGEDAAGSRWVLSFTVSFF